jgi:signal transduction histidine kinase
MLISFAIWVIYEANQRSESELSEQAMELEEQADELAQQLKVVEKQQELLLKANATKDKFFSIIAHDLKNPSHNLLGFAELLATKFDSLEPEKAKTYSHMIYEASESINDLINNLLQWSRTQRGKIEIKPDSFSVNELLTKNVNLQKLAADQKSIRLEITCPSNLTAYADFNMMDTVVRNLLSNAIKFTPDDGVIQLSGKKEGKNAVLSISDTGRGMDAEEVSRLFRIDKTFSKEGTAGEKGTGLGLIIVQEFIAKNNGQIGVKSEKNRGSIFTITLPASAPD